MICCSFQDISVVCFSRTSRTQIFLDLPEPHQPCRNHEVLACVVSYYFGTDLLVLPMNVDVHEKAVPNSSTFWMHRDTSFPSPHVATLPAGYVVWLVKGKCTIGLPVGNVCFFEGILFTRG